MPHKNLKNIGLSLRKQDGDLIAWFNEMNRQEQSASRWIGALLVAYVEGELIPTQSAGTYILPKKEVVVESDDELGLFTSKTKAKSVPNSWAVRDSNDDYTYGTVLNFKLTNNKSLEAYRTIKSQDEKISSVIRMMIREGFKESCDDYQQVYSNLTSYNKSESEDEMARKFRDRVKVGTKLKPVQEAPLDKPKETPESVEIPTQNDVNVPTTSTTQPPDNMGDNAPQPQKSPPKKKNSMLKYI